MEGAGDYLRELWRDPANRARLLGRPDTWPPEKLAELLRLHALGSLTLSEMGHRLGFSRGAIQGKLSRLGLSVSRKPPRPKAAKIARFRPKSKPKVTRMEQILALPLSPTAKCRFIEGEPSGDDACKCGRPAIEGKAWCPEHHARVYIPYVRKAQAA